MCWTKGSIGPSFGAFRPRTTPFRIHISFTCGFRKGRAEGSSLVVLFSFLFPPHFWFFIAYIEPRPEDCHSSAPHGDRWN